jgi:predicted dehydrogenase
MSDKPLRAGVVGVGSMGRHHARVYDELNDVELVGVTDADPDRAEEIARQYNAATLDPDELLATADAISIAVPTEYHYEFATRAIDAGVHALVEKPLVETPSRGTDLLERARQEDVVLQVGHVERFNPAVRTLMDICVDLDVIAVEAQRLGPPINREIQDNAVFDLMIHDIDVILSLLDAPIESVSAFGAVENRHITANLEFADGVVSTLTASRVTQQKIRRLSITAEECRVNVDYLNQSIDVHRHSVPEYIEQNGDVRYRHESIIERPMVDNAEPLKEELGSFVTAIRDGQEPVVTAEDGLRALEIARRIDDLARRDKVALRPEVNVHETP